MNFAVPNSGFQLLEPDRPSLQRLLDQLEEAENMNEVAGIFTRFPIEFGFDAASIVIVREGQKHLMAKRVLTTLPKSARERILTRSFIRDNRTIREVLTQRRPRSFSIRRSKAPDEAKCPEQRYSHGLAFAVTYDSGLEAVVFLYTFKDLNWVTQRRALHGKCMFGMAQQFVDAFVYFNSVGSSGSRQLSEDELTFLRTLAVSDDPGAVKFCDYRFGSAIILQRSIARKLGVKSLYQAVAICAKRGTIDCHRLNENEIAHSEHFLNGWNEL